MAAPGDDAAVPARRSAVALALAVLLSLATTLGRRILLKTIDAKITEQVVWRADSPPAVHDRFTGALAPSSVFDVFFLNITNLEEVRNGSKPVLQEVGPYRYMKKERRLEPQWLEGSAQVRWKTLKQYHRYRPSDGCGCGCDAGAPGRRAAGLAGTAPELPPPRDPTADEVVVPNLALLGALDHAFARLPGAVSRYAAELVAKAVVRMTDGSAAGLFVRRSPAELLEGYSDPLLALLQPIMPGLDPVVRLLPNASEEQARADGWWSARTGEEDRALVGQLTGWKGTKAVLSWRAPHVETVRGVNGDQFPPGVRVGDRQLVWSGEMYRATHVHATGEVEAPAGRAGAHGSPPRDRVRLVRFEPAPDAMAPSEEYFQRYRGLVNVTSPRDAGPTGSASTSAGPKLFLSLPHFCGVDPAAAETVLGLRCLGERHGIQVDVQPETGITVRTARRMQLSTEVGPSYGPVDPLVAHAFVPVFWGEELLAAEPESLAQFLPLQSAMRTAAVLRYAAPPLALILFALSGVLAWIAIVRYDAKRAGEVAADAAAGAPSRSPSRNRGATPGVASHPLADDSAAEPLLAAGGYGVDDSDLEGQRTGVTSGAPESCEADGAGAAHAGGSRAEALSDVLSAGSSLATPASSRPTSRTTVGAESSHGRAFAPDASPPPGPTSGASPALLRVGRPSSRPVDVDWPESE